MPSSSAKTLPLLNKEIISCTACPRLVQWREEVAITKRKAYENEKYWGKPVPSFGCDQPKLLIVGLAPGAHGANRTGRIFTGDSSGDWLYDSLYRAGLATIPTSTSIKDGQKLIDTRIACAVRCAPPDNKPRIEERDACAPYLTREIEIASRTASTYVALGSFAWSALIKSLRQIGYTIPTTKFSHGVKITFKDENRKFTLIGSYHPSQQNTFTGKLTTPMLDKIFKQAAKTAEIEG
ncbi:MAG: uracil-DNA glycosylase [Candidatus Planktophila sp.]